MTSSGILLLDKADGTRSTACVDRVRTILGRKTKVGHAGTLDSTASGLLVLLVGKATRLASLVMSFSKAYQASIQCGVTTSTDDRSGEVLSRRPFGHIYPEGIRRVLPGFLGWRSQVPPQVSAVHVAGQRAHDLARKGVVPELSPRPVFLCRLDLTGFDPASGRMELRVLCSKGTYVRSLARDLGEQLGCGAHLAALRRTHIGPWAADQGLPSDQAFGASSGFLEEALLPLDSLQQTLPSYRAGAKEAEACLHGAPLRLDRLQAVAPGTCPSAGLVLVLHGHGVSLYRPAYEGDQPILACEANLGEPEALLS